MEPQSDQRLLAPYPPSNERRRIIAEKTEGTFSGANSRPASRRNVSVACEPCRERRAKCDGNRPCTRCRGTETECVYAQNPDGRSFNAVKRKLETMEKDQELFHELIGTIRDSSREQGESILSLIRNHTSLQTIKSAIGDQLKKVQRQNKELTQSAYNMIEEVEETDEQDQPQPSSSISRDVLQISRLADVPLHQVPTSPWTTITDDTDLVSNLISVWITWDKPFMNWMDHHLFLVDMKSQKLDSTYCSRFLVNAILAWACPYSDYNETRDGGPWQPGLMKEFLEEARKLSKIETGKRPTLPTVQGMLYLYGATSIVYGEQTAKPLMTEVVGLTRQLDRLYRDQREPVNDLSTKKFYEAIDRTCWGVFNVVTALSLTFMQPTPMTAPERLRPRAKDMDDDGFEMWIPYPRGGDALPAHVESLYNIMCEFSVLAAEFTIKFGMEGGRYPRAEIEEESLRLYACMEDRIQALPNDLCVRKSAAPTIHTYHIAFQFLILSMFSFSKLSINDVASETQQNVQTARTDAAIRVAEICQYYVDDYGTSNMNISMVQTMSRALCIIMSLPDAISYHNEITVLSTCLRAQCRRWSTLMPLLRMAQVEAERHNTLLPDKVDKIFQEFEEDWNSEWGNLELSMRIEGHSNNRTDMFKGENSLALCHFLQQLCQLRLSNEF